MAKATKVPSDYTINLELNREEAEVLRFVLGSICGSFDTSPRATTYHLMAVLSGAGVGRRQFMTAPGKSEISFLDYNDSSLL